VCEAEIGIARELGKPIRFLEPTLVETSENVHVGARRDGVDELTNGATNEKRPRLGAS
jgi:hypothetical protein